MNFKKPTIEEYFYGRPVVYGCEDHRLREEDAYRFGEYKQWEAAFLRHLLGHTTFEEEHEFTEKSQENYYLCNASGSLQMRMGKRFTSLLRHGSNLKHEMYSQGAVEMKRVFDFCGRDVNPPQHFKFGKQFAAFIQGNNKQRYFVEVELKEKWILGRDMSPWKITLDVLKDTQQE